tara:strand:- start:120447 stop:120623 length:177 start_codon:yes stop_codon:yes gene_type:complete
LETAFQVQQELSLKSSLKLKIGPTGGKISLALGAVSKGNPLLLETAKYFFVDFISTTH